MKKVSDIMKARNTIRAYVKEALLESSVSPESDLAAIVDDRGDEVVAIIYDSPSLLAQLDVIEGFAKSRDVLPAVPLVRDVVKGYIKIISPESSDEDLGNCNGAWIVSHAAGPGYGKIIYGMGYALSPSGLLASDRLEVSTSARRAWKKAAASRRGLPFDDIDDPKTPPEEDDCVIHNTRGGKHLNYSYESQGWEAPMAQKLIKKSDEVMANFSPLAKKMLETAFLYAGAYFFKEHYQNA